MPSSKPFVFDVAKLNRFLNGDIGIADRIHAVQIAPILNAIKYPDDKALFQKLQEPNRSAGLWAMEKSIVSSMMESQKPFVELAKICLQLFGSLEYVVAVLLGGRNPDMDPNSFSSAYRENKSAMGAFDTGMSTDSADNTADVLPERIFLGKYRRSANSGNVNQLTTGPEHGEFYPGYYWPQYQTYQQFFNEEDAKLRAAIVNVPIDMQQDVIDGRFQNIGDEWAAMNTENQLAKAYSGQAHLNGIINISKYFKPQDLVFQGLPVTVDIEDNYDVFVTKSIRHSPSYFEDFYITAVIKPEYQGSRTGVTGPQFFLGGPDGLVKAIKAFFKRVLPIVLDRLIPTLVAFKKLMSEPVGFVGEILMSKLKEHFEMFDPSLKDRPADDPKRNKYWSGDTFVMDGSASIEVGLMNITLGIKDAVPNFKVGKEDLPPGTKENPILKQVANVAALPLNFMKGVLDAFMDLFKKIFKIVHLPQAVSEFLTFKWIKDLMGLPKLLEFLGAQNGDLTKIPFLSVPADGAVEFVPAMLQAFLKVIVQFINGFIGIPNTILNVELVPQIPVP